MEEDNSTVNAQIVKLFNEVLEIEEGTLRNGPLQDLSITELHTIDAIGTNSKKTMSDVAEILEITVSTLTTAIDKLIKKGYVERKRIPEDRRVVIVSLSKKGKLAYNLHEKFHKDMVNETIYQLTDDEKRVLISSLNKINEFFKEKKEQLKDKGKQ